MLCTKIIFTNVSTEQLTGLAVYTKANHRKAKLCGNEEYAVLDINDDDESLYLICAYVSEHILGSIIKKSLSRMLSAYYNCFNTDELEHICINVLNRDFIKELPGRMYVYLKVNRCINPDGFYTFMCTDIRKASFEYAREEADKMLELNDRLDMIETLKYFSDMSMESAEKVILHAGPEGIKITECIPFEEKTSAEFGAEETDVLAELVTLNPMKIEIYGKENFLKSEISSVIEAVFENRIEYK